MWKSPGKSMRCTKKGFELINFEQDGIKSNKSQAKITQKRLMEYNIGQ